MDQLEQGRSRPLTLISAPAGYGKSQLCSAWLDSRDLPHAWLSLDEDDDLRRFLQHLLAAVSSLFTDALDPTWSLVGARDLPPVSVLADSLANDFDSIGERFVLVLDDLHLVRHGAAVDLIFELLRHPPRPLHLVLISRRDPPLPLAKWRAEGTMSEIRSHDLRFGRSETAELLKGLTGLAVNEHALDTIEQRLEGWVVSLRLAALALRRVADVDSLIARLSGGFLHIQDYLVQEVLAGLPFQVKDWMLKVSILDRFCEDLCGAVCGGDVVPVESAFTGAEFLTTLQQSNLFAIALDSNGEWFRFHHLFRDLLSDRLLRSLGSDEVAELHLRAADWYERRGLIDEAIRHGLASGDTGWTARVVERHIPPLMSAETAFIISDWLSRLPEAEILSSPGLLLGRAYTLAFNAEYHRLLPIIDRVDTLVAGDPSTHDFSMEVSIFRGLSAYKSGNVEPGLEHLERAADRVSTTERKGLDAMAVVHFLLAGHMAGQGEKMRALATRWLGESPLTDGRKAYLQLALRHMALCDGDLEVVERRIEADREFAEHHGLHNYVAWCDHHSGSIHLLRGELGASVPPLENAGQRKYFHWRRGALDSMAALAIAYQALGLPERAAEVLESMGEFADHVGGLSGVYVDSCATRLRIMQGRSDLDGWRPDTHASDIVVPMEVYFEIPVVTRCRALIAGGTTDSLVEASRLLGKYADLNDKHHNTLKLIELYTLQAAAFDRLGEDERALTVLERAVGLASAPDIVFPFLELGLPMCDLLGRLPGADHAAFFDRVVAAIDRPAGGRQLEDERRPRSGRLPPDHLTNRESEVLELLAQRLFDKEIAARLHISASTVNSHCKHIYQKLDVRNRRQAVATAIEFGILEGRGE